MSEISRPQADSIVVSWLVACYIATTCLVGPVAGLLIDLTTSRTCILLSGVVSLVGFSISSLAPDVSSLFLTLCVSSVGQGLSLVGSTVVLSVYFPTTTSIANGILMCGVGLGSFFHPPILQYLIDEYGLRGAFLIIGAISFHSCLAGMLIKPHPTERKKAKISKKEDSVNRRTNQEFLSSVLGFVYVLRNPAFLMFLLCNISNCMGFIILIVYLPEYLIHIIHLDEQLTARASSLVGIGVASSRLLSGFIANDAQIGHRVVYFGLNALTSLVCCFGPVIMTHIDGGAYVFSIVFGLYAGGPIAMFVSITLDCLSEVDMSRGIGLCYMFGGVGYLLGPPLAANIVQVVGYNGVLYLCAACYLFTVVAYSISCVFSARKKATRK